MKTANLMDVASVKNINLQMGTSRKLQEENVEASELFAGLMNQTLEMSNPQAYDAQSDKDVVEVSDSQLTLESYERYSYKDNQIESVKENDSAELLEETTQVLEQAEEEIVNMLIEEYGVDKETIQNLLDEMGLTALDLLNPKNLVSFVVELTGVASGEELLLDESFLGVMETLENLTDGLMKDLNVDMEGLQGLIAEMELVDVEQTAEFQDVLDNVIVDSAISGNGSPSKEQGTAVENAAEVEADVEADVKLDESTQNSSDVTKVPEEEVVDDKTKMEQSETLANVQEDVSKEEVSVEEQEMLPTVEEDEESKESLRTNSQEVNLEKSVAEMEHVTETTFAEENGTDNHSFMNQNPENNQPIVLNPSSVNAGMVNDMSQVQFQSYLSADTVQIMEQIVQQMRVTISAERTSMEMQLNPENLGKVYVKLSSEEGVVNAQFHATNEIVKEALENQIATLRENLNQAGVKVDAIEVTIASHEFERNLEQNHQNPQEQVESKENQNSKRRNLTIDSLDELSGVMTEEETLVAQIMKDNGNSVDLTA